MNTINRLIPIILLGTISCSANAFNGKGEDASRSTASISGDKTYHFREVYARKCSWHSIDISSHSRTKEVLVCKNVFVGYEAAN